MHSPRDWINTFHHYLYCERQYSPVTCATITSQSCIGPGIFCQGTQALTTGTRSQLITYNAISHIAIVAA